jgi:hypothetical protein
MGLLIHTLDAPNSPIFPFACEVESILTKELDVELEHKVEHEKLV